MGTYIHPRIQALHPIMAASARSADMNKLLDGNVPIPIK
jgi:hypothetical protein